MTYYIYTQAYDRYFRKSDYYKRTNQDSRNRELPNHNGNYKVVFRNVPSVYTYKEENVLWLTDPDKPDPNNYQIISKGRTLSNIKALSIFKAGSHNYWHIRFLNGKEYDYREKDLEIIESCLGESRSKSIFEYLKKVADANELKADDGTKLLAKQYEKIHFIANNRAIAVYLNPQKYKMQTRTASTLIFLSVVMQASKKQSRQLLRIKSVLCKDLRELERPKRF